MGIAFKSLYLWYSKQRIEECNEETLDKWLETLEREGLIRTIKVIIEVVNMLGEHFDIIKE